MRSGGQGSGQMRQQQQRKKRCQPESGAVRHEQRSSSNLQQTQQSLLVVSSCVYHLVSSVKVAISGLMQQACSLHTYSVLHVRRRARVLYVAKHIALTRYQLF
jgi:hypothetical protein